ncbi:MAG: alpha/beta hydrolase [Pseudomonadota bacterium]|nr:alpha/beta hydrolase [Pseudomonadota bacterium]
MTWKTQPRSDFGPLQAITVPASNGSSSQQNGSAEKGPLAILLHGVGLRAEAWAAQIPVLSDLGFDVLAPDMPGHGQSAFTPLDNVQGYAELLGIALTQQTPDRDCLLIGHSMGAMIALELAQQHAKQCIGVIAMNAIFQRETPARAAVAARAAQLDGVSLPDPSPTLTRWFGAETSDPLAERDACHDWLTTVSPRGYQQAYRCFANSDGPTTQSLQTLRCPALFLTGAEEPNSTPAMSIAMADLAPNGRAEVIAGAAHMMPMTHAPETNSAVQSFAKECLHD